MAAGGVRFSQFYNSGRCCPTRATLMTGLHPHETGVGWMTEPPGSKRGDSEPPAYQGNLNDRCVTVAEVLRSSGYATMMAGKWHLGADEREDWPLQRGFERFYGCLSGATRFFSPERDRGMSFGNEAIAKVESTTDEEYYTTDAFTDYAIRFLQEEQEGKDRPSFLYLAYTAPHWPLQAFEDDIAKYRGRYKDVGWDRLRDRRFARQKELGLYDDSVHLSTRTKEIPEWHTLDEEKRDEMDLKMAVYAAMIDRIDQNIGKLLAYLKKSGRYEDTLILFLSDNGACQEGGMLGRGEFYDIKKRNSQTANSYGEAWSNASNTPLRLYKHFAHEGGTATPFFLHWPKGIDPESEWYREPAQLIDVLPTLADVAGASYPDDAPALDGISLRSAFGAAELGREEPIFIEHETNGSVRDGNWKLVGRTVSTLSGTKNARWELYDMASDPTETLNLAMAEPEKVAALAEKWEAWAQRVKVYPRGEKSPPGTKSRSKAPGRPPAIGGREFTVTATIEAGSPQGTILSHGGNWLGYALHVDQGKPVFVVRNQGKISRIVGEEALSGKVTVSAWLGKEAMTLWVDGVEVARGPSPGVIAEQPGLGFYLGEDFQDAVGDYKPPNRFNGTVLNHHLEIDRQKVSMQTRWGKDLDADSVWSEYPRPALAREHWVNLNGHWDYAVTAIDQEESPAEWAGKILVPFAIEAPLSGVEEPFTPEDALWYQRMFTFGKREKGKRTLLHFEAVDYACTVWVNGQEVGRHVGGNLPFSFDVTSALREGGNELRLRVTDATDTAYQLHGKQRLQPRGIWYTPVSGIWQTVWMETVPESSVDQLNLTPAMDGSVHVEAKLRGSGSSDEVLIMTVSLEGEEVTRASGPASGFTLSIPDPQLWSPESPTLYDLEVRLGEDVVRSYVGLREVGRMRDAEGHLRFTLNGNPYFHWGTLDQGWWPDGLLTPPSDEAMRYDIEFLKAAGFNTIRKHIKVEPRRYYTHCDRMGMLVWQDQVSAMSQNPDWPRLAPHPPRVQWPEEAHEQYLYELKEMIDLLYSHPSIVQWVPFNERWGQHQTMKVGEWVVDYDSSRDINIASGGNFFPVGHVVDAHAYPHPVFPWHHGEGGRFDPFVKVMGEFGGHGFPVEGHVWSLEANNWGYGGLPKDKEEWLARYEESIRKLKELKAQGIAGGIYTQTTDVEGEINGLLTYDREVAKVEPAKLKEMAEGLVE
ncbi:MAG: sulfatase-like hydrolase/transferase [Verrucomicrobiota bacterium]